MKLKILLSSLFISFSLNATVYAIESYTYVSDREGHNYSLAKKIATCAAVMEANSATLYLFGKPDESIVKGMNQRVLGWRMAAITGFMESGISKSTAIVVTDSVFETTANDLMTELGVKSKKKMPKSEALALINKTIKSLQSKWDGCLQYNDSVEELQQVARRKYM
jgi:hypothetical protein